jgi:acetyl esterase/lipase
MKNIFKGSCFKKGCGCLLVLVIILAIATYLLKPKWNDEYGERFTDVEYGQMPHNTYDLFLPVDAAKKDSLALILYVHGGSWLGGDKNEHHGDCYAWVQKGYATATMNYSLLNEENISLQTMQEEIDVCIRHIMRFATEKGVHIRQMAIAGTSAGGHLAMLYAYSHTHALPLRFAAIKVGPADFRILFPHEENAKSEDWENFVFVCTGKRVSSVDYSRQFADSIKLLASPIHYINDSTALPAIFAYGEKDELIKPAHYHAISALYDSLGKPYDLIVYPNSGHILINDKECSEQYDSVMCDYCKNYFGY